MTTCPQNSTEWTCMLIFSQNATQGTQQKTFHVFFSITSSCEALQALWRPLMQNSKSFFASVLADQLHSNKWEPWCPVVAAGDPISPAQHIPSTWMLGWGSRRIQGQKDLSSGKHRELSSHLSGEYLIWSDMFSVLQMKQSFFFCRMQSDVC